MNKLLMLDAQNYAPGLPEIYRVSIRGVILVDGKLLMIEDSFGEVKLPGGGMDPGETEAQTLIREVQEETGYTVRPESIRPFGEIEERRMSVHEPMIWHQINRIYFCEVDPVPGACRYTENERKYRFHRVLYSLEEALKINEAMLAREGVQAWNQREYQTLRLLQNHFARHTGTV